MVFVGPTITLVTSTLYITAAFSDFPSKISTLCFGQNLGCPAQQNHDVKGASHTIGKIGC